MYQQKRFLKLFFISFGLYFGLISGFFLRVSAQELNCRVNVAYSQLSGGTDFQFLQRDFAPAIEAYFNEHLWTEDKFEKDERIDCSFFINITKATGLDKFEVQVTVGASRPIYGTSVETQLFQISDNSWKFSYVPNQALIHDPNRFDPLVSVLDYYAYLILGYDYDSFSQMGGTPHFEKARSVVELAQTSGSVGWQVVTTGSEFTRGKLIQEITEPRMRAFREASFTYHYEGLDHFLESPDRARQKVLEALTALQQLVKQGSRNSLLDIFLSAKVSSGSSSELVSIFLESNVAPRAYGLLIDIDSAGASKYDLLQGN